MDYVYNYMKIGNREIVGNYFKKYFNIMDIDSTEKDF